MHTHTHTTNIRTDTLDVYGTLRQTIRGETLV